VSKANSTRLSKRRFVLSNPYAHIEQLLESMSFADRIRESRINLQNPYAYLDGNGEFSALQSSVDRPERIAFKDIEELAKGLQRRLWSERSKFWPDNIPTDPVQVLDPSIASRMVGFDFEFVDSLGVFTDRAEKIGVAGLIDRSTNTIKISRDFLPPVRTFTAAHELGHAILHPGMSLHRDRAFDGTRVRRDRVELEADKFATYFLLPEKLVRKIFLDRFLTSQFVLCEDTAFALLLKSAADAARFKNRRALSRKLASSTQYNGRNFYSLAEYFNVTVETMAIRLEELSLVDA